MFIYNSYYKRDITSEFYCDVVYTVQTASYDIHTPNTMYKPGATPKTPTILSIFFLEEL